jgi:hypothetical protein
MTEIKSPLKAIKEHCKWCCGDDLPKNCVSEKCELYPFRLGKNPFLKREMTEEQKQAAAERFAKYREENKK